MRKKPPSQFWRHGRKWGTEYSILNVTAYVLEEHEGSNTYWLGYLVGHIGPVVSTRTRVDAMAYLDLVYP
jgi:hypothetical protein